MNSKTFNMSLPGDLLKKVDAVAKREYRNRSELIREAVRKYIQDTEEWMQMMEYGRSKARAKGITSEVQVNRLVREQRHGKRK